MEQDNEKSIQSLIMEISRMYMEKCFVKLKKVGIHPARVKKLMVSTNICGKKLAVSGYKFHYSFEDTFKDWFEDCNKQGLQ